MDCEGGQRHAPAALPPNNTRYPLYRRLGGPQRRYEGGAENLAPAGFDPPTDHPVASRYTDRAIPAYNFLKYIYIKLIRQYRHAHAMNIIIIIIIINFNVVYPSVIQPHIFNKAAQPHNNDYKRQTCSSHLQWSGNLRVITAFV